MKGNDSIVDFSAGDRIDVSAFALSGFNELDLQANGARLDLTDYGGGVAMISGFGFGSPDDADFKGASKN